MSRVTIEGLYSDFTVPRTNAREWGVNFEQYERLANTEIVPRKMVEMIIEMCDEIIDDSETAVEFFREIGYFEEACDGIFEANIRKSVANSFKTYAESLLERFEEDREDGRN